MAQVLRDVRAVLPVYLAQRHPGRALVLGFVLPWTAVRGVALVVSGFITRSVIPGAVLGLMAWFMQLGVWAALSLTLPVLARTLRWHLRERHAMALAAIMCAPLWAAGVLFAVPQEPHWAFLLSRCVVFLACLHGITLFVRASTLMPAPKAVLRPLWVSAVASYALIYGVFFALFGVCANLLLWYFPAGG